MERDIDLHLATLKENSVDFISTPELEAKLKKSFSRNQPLKLKIGFDPTASDIHLGHAVLLRKLRKLQDLGHDVYLVIGDFTAKIGDPSGRSALRPVLTDTQIKNNAATYTAQAFKILDKKKTKVIYNSSWYKDMALNDFLSVLSSYTMARILERDDFAKRLKENKPLTMLEVIYPLVQGYDSVMLGADVEFGGTDQKFNLLVGRRLQEDLGRPAQAIITMPILVGLDGKEKMSKSLGNYVGVTDEPRDMFGKVMSISDTVMRDYFRLLTEHSIDEIRTMHPKEAKLLLAQELCAFYHSAAAAAEARREFERVFSQKEIPADIPVYKACGEINIVDVLFASGTVSSKNEVRRLLAQGAISRVDREPAQVFKAQIVNVPAAGMVLKIGKRKFLKLQANNKRPLKNS